MFIEIEIGPHFITLYNDDFKEMLTIARNYYKEFTRKYSDYAGIQQDNFTHQAGDPLVYHRFGKPDIIREHFKHFHIRTESFPPKWLIASICQDLTIDMNTILITYFEETYKDFHYPVRKENQSYLEYIEYLKEVTHV